MDAGFAAIPHHFLADVDKFEPLLLRYGVFIIVAAVAVEGFGIPAPGQTLLIVAAVMSVRANSSIYGIMFAAWFAAVAGSTIGYAMGRIGGRRLLQRLPVSEARLQRMEVMCRRYGSLFIVMSRFLDGFRQFGSMLVGSLSMPLQQFMLMTTLGAALWVSVWGLGVYYLDEHIHTLAAGFRRLSPYTWGAAGIMVVATVFYLFRGTGKR